MDWHNYVPLFSPAPSKRQKPVCFTEEDEMLQCHYKEHDRQWISPNQSDSNSVEIALSDNYDTLESDTYYDDFKDSEDVDL